MKISFYSYLDVHEFKYMKNVKKFKDIFKAWIKPFGMKKNKIGNL